MSNMLLGRGNGRSSLNTEKEGTRRSVALNRHAPSSTLNLQNNVPNSPSSCTGKKKDVLKNHFEFIYSASVKRCLKIINK